MRSQKLLSFKHNVSELNKNYSHFLFISEQFINDNKRHIEDSPDSETTEIFDNNKYVNQFRCKLSSLYDEYNSTMQFILCSFFVLSCSQFEVYLKNLYNFAKTFLTELPEYNNIFENIETQFDLSQYMFQEELDTLLYIRLRRNTLMHRSHDSPSQKTINDLINKCGKKLNKYWRENDKRTDEKKGKIELKISSLDFTDKSLAKFNNEELIDIINLIRRFAEKIDKVVLERIGFDNLLDSLFKEFCSNPKNVGDIEKIERKFRHFAVISLGLNYSEKDWKKYWECSSVVRALP